MKVHDFYWVTIVALMLAGGTASLGQELAPPVVYPLAIFPFQERGKEVADMGGKVTDILFANLVANPQIYLVEREELKKLLENLEISQAGLTDPKQSNQVGRLTGAKVLVTGSIFQVGDKTYVVAKLIGTETGRVIGASVKGKLSDDLDTLVEHLAKDVAANLAKQGEQLVGKPVAREDRAQALAKALGANTPRPAIYIDVSERHVGQVVTDPAAETELAKLCADLGFKVIDRQTGDKSEAEILLVGEGFSQFAARHSNLVSVKARLELKAVDRKTGRVLAVDRQTAIGVDLAELIASKEALQEAAAEIASRLIPAMLKPIVDQPKAETRVQPAAKESTPK